MPHSGVQLSASYSRIFSCSIQVGNTTVQQHSIFVTVRISTHCYSSSAVLLYEWIQIGYSHTRRSDNELDAITVRFVLRDELDMSRASLDSNELPFLTLRKWLMKPVGSTSFTPLASETHTTIVNLTIPKETRSCIQFILVLKVCITQLLHCTVLYYILGGLFEHSCASTE